MAASILEERKSSIILSGAKKGVSCEKESVSGSVSQRACVFCGARVVLNPITDACHIVHGPIGCASYTWDIRGSLTSGGEAYRNSYSTDLRETDIVFGGEKKLKAAIDELMESEQKPPKLIFVYATCIVGVIGDDVEAVCRESQKKWGIRVIPVKAPGFSGTKSQGYKLACDAIMDYISPFARQPASFGINILGDYNLAGEMWIVKGYFEKIGIPVISTITGDASSESLIKAPSASLNVVQCAGSASYLAQRMEAEMGVPWLKASFYGAQDISSSIVRVADALKDAAICEKARAFTAYESERARSVIDKYKPRFEGKKAAIFVGGGFKAISLIRQFKEFGMKIVLVGTQTGKRDEYDVIESIADDGAVVLDDANPAELEQFMAEKGADILVGGVKERPLAYKLGVAFLDHNHERKHPLAGYIGIENFASEVNLSMNSPVWHHLGMHC
ncbi:MAG: nitrogenase iron-molybdenum cofactor biosynthesis protein NifE [Clostridiales bacterium]|jgi:nitrogenase molybdenum-cofactor synthesis protein NifE|nr:nitrogenase iron-molybdenum cofactor biosynthesis protein NifE [Clostridiales bacterium]